MKATNTAMNSVRSSVRQMSAAGQSDFRAAEDEIKRAERELRDSLRAVRRATAAEWESARAELAADFDAYASALARVDALAGVPVSR